ncbi:hypothetical protein JT053_07670 [Helicobacter pylori]|nr:hypothetical protein [Helicobacter pylori]
MRLETHKIGGCKGNKNPVKLTKKERDFLGGKWAKYNLFIAKTPPKYNLFIAKTPPKYNLFIAKTPPKYNLFNYK